MTDLLFLLTIAGSTFALAFFFLSNGPLVSLWRWHSRSLSQHYSFLILDRDAAKDAACHLGLCGALAMLALSLNSFPLLLLLPPLALAPELLLQGLESRKRETISEQLAPWLTVLANSLKSSPNISDAFGASMMLVSSPLREEIDLLVKEVQLGEHLDRAMHRSAKRLESPLYSSVMTTLLVARKSGGNLPEILESSSGTLREMERLAGVVRAKTAEGKSQVAVLSVLPFVMVGALYKVDPHMIPKLAQSGLGQIILGVATALWLCSIALARRIVQVDI